MAPARVLAHVNLAPFRCPIAHADSRARRNPTVQQAPNESTAIQKKPPSSSQLRLTAVIPVVSSGYLVIKADRNITER
jgi:hypothetical protein